MADYKPAHNPNPDTNPATAQRANEGAERFKDATSGAAGTAHDKVDRAAEGMHRGADKVAGAAGRASQRSREAMDYAKAHANDWMDTTRDYVRENPAQSVAIAVAAGWLIGRLMRRH